MEQNPTQVDRTKLKEERKERKRLKRKTKRMQRQEENEQNKLLLQAKPQGDKVSIITPEFVEKKLKIQVKPEKQERKENILIHKDFPTLSETVGKTLVTTPRSPGLLQYVNVTMENKRKTKSADGNNRLSVNNNHEQTLKQFKMREIEKKPTLLNMQQTNVSPRNAVKYKPSDSPVVTSSLDSKQVNMPSTKITNPESGDSYSLDIINKRNQHSKQIKSKESEKKPAALSTSSLISHQVKVIPEKLKPKSANFNSRSVIINKQEQQLNQIKTNVKMKEPNSTGLLISPQVSLISENVKPKSIEFNSFSVLNNSVEQSNQQKTSENYKKPNVSKEIGIVQASSSTKLVKTTKPKSNDPISVNLSEILNNLEQASKHAVKVKQPEKKTIVVANPLDSSKPEKKTGKHYDIPKVKKKKKLKRMILEDNEKLQQEEIVTFAKYADNEITFELDIAAKDLISKIVDMQEKFFEKFPEKGRRKKRYVVGLHEAKRLIAVRKIQILIIAAQMRIAENGALHKVIKEIISLCKIKGIPYLFALNRKSLGVFTLKFVPICCIGIINFEGAEEYFVRTVCELNTAREKYEKMHFHRPTSTEKEEASEDVNLKLLMNFMQALKPEDMYFK